MKQFEPKTFEIPELKGISAKTTEEHLKLYAGYVKNANSVVEQISNLGREAEKNMYMIGELFRRFSFEFNGMRNHEVYFSSLSGGPKPLPADSSLAKLIIETCNSFEIFMFGMRCEKIRL